MQICPNDPHEKIFQETELYTDIPKSSTFPSLSEEIHYNLNQRRNSLITIIEKQTEYIITVTKKIEKIEKNNEKNNKNKCIIL